jgi:tetratricopeptide (TPR) repeat protein
MDLWPLQRFTGVSGRTAARRRLLWEKLPLVLVAAGSSIVTILAQRAGTAMVQLEALPLGARLGNAVLSYGVYLMQAVWPARLAVHYPHPGTDLPLFPTLSALALRPDYAQAWNNLGVALARRGRHAEARTKFEAAVALRQDYGRAWLNLAAACLVTGDMAAWAEAMARARDLGL